jgi:uncharacterized membrane protein YdjX (TVP38/TMEM64 family)
VKSKRWTDYLRSKRLWVVVVTIAVLLILLHGKVSIEDVRAEAEKLPGWLCFLLLTLLPLFGCPVNVLHAAAGLRFGLALGLPLVWLSILIQLVASFGLVHWHREFFARHLKSIRERIPSGAHVPVTVFTMLIPGAPYFAQNYALALIGVPFRLYLGICLPMHAARSSIAVMIGGESDDLTTGKVLLILAYGAAILGASWWALRRLRTKLGDQRRAENDRKQPA